MGLRQRPYTACKSVMVVRYLKGQDCEDDASRRYLPQSEIYSHQNSQITMSPRPAMLRRSCNQPLSNDQIWILCLQSLYRAIRSISLELRQSKRLRSIRNHHMTDRLVRQHSPGTLPLNLAPTSHTCIIETHNFTLVKMIQDHLTARGRLEVPRRRYHGRDFPTLLGLRD